MKFSVEGKKRKYLKRISWALFAVLLLLILFYNIPFPVKTEFSALEIDIENPAVSVQHSGSIDGIYRFNLFHDNSFSGSIRVSGYPITGGRMSDIYFGDKTLRNHRYHDAMFYQHEEAPNAEYESSFFALFCSNLFMGNIVFVCMEESNGNAYSIGTRRIVQDAVNRDDALETLDRLGLIDMVY